jgi:hypothetical protein
MADDIRYTTAGVDFKGTFVSWEDLEAERAKFRFANSVLVKVSFDYGRVSHIEDQAIYEREAWDNIKAVLEGTTAYFSDFAGKHSQTNVDFWSNVDLEEITDLEQIIAFHKCHGFSNEDLGIISQGLEQAEENGEIGYRDGTYYRITEAE